MPGTLTERLLEIYQNSPEQAAIHLLHAHQSDQTISYKELLAGAARYVEVLAKAGVRPGEIAVLILPHSADLVFAFWGAILHGAIPAIMPFLTEKLSPEQYRKSLAALFEITEPGAVITYLDFMLEVEVARRNNTSIHALLVSAEIPPQVEWDINSFCGLRRDEQDIVLLQHSSGTTGLQKGVALSHATVFNQLESYTEAIRLTPSDVIVSWLPLYHDMGLIAGFILPVLYRVPLVLLSPFDWVRAPYKLMQAVSCYRGTLTWLPNFAYNFCARKIRDRDLEGVDLSNWRAVINCSEPIHARSNEMFAARFACCGFRPDALATCYGMAENVFAVTQGGIDRPAVVDTVSQQAFLSEGFARQPQAGESEMQLVSSGRVIAGTELVVLDDSKNPLPDRRLGEIAIRSNCMLTGYYNRPDETRKAFHDGWYLTGDLGYLADGELFVTGRKKDLIIFGGKNIYPQDLERIACEVDGIHPGRAVAFGVFDPEIGTEEVVIVAEAESDQADFTHLANEIRRRVTTGSDIALRYVRVVRHGWLLKTSSGKIARAANRDKYLVERAADAG